MDHQDARRQVARVGVDAGVVVEVAVRRLEMDPGGDPPATDRQERQPERSVRPVELEQPTEEDPALGAARRVGEEPVGAPALLVQVDERLEVGERVGRIVEADRPDRLRAADLAPDLVALLLAERGEVLLHVGAGRQRHDRADVLALDVERPALGDLARPERRGQRVRGRIAAAQAAQVDDVPRPALGGLGEVVGERRGDGRQVGRGGEDRRVVGVVRGAEEDRGGGRRDRRQLDAGAVAHRRVGERRRSARPRGGA